MTRCLLVLALVGLVALCAACPKTGGTRKTQLRKRPPPRGPKPKRSPPKARFAKEKKLIQEIQRLRQRIKSLEGRAKLRIYRPNKRRQTLRMLYQLQRPNKIALQVIAAAMQPILIVTCNGTAFSSYNIAQNHFILGQASQLPQLLGDFLPTHVPLPQLIAALLGEIPILQGAIQSSTRKGDLLVLKLKGKRHSQTLWLHPTQKIFTKTQLQIKNKPSLVLEYGTHRGSPPLPKRIKFIMAKKKRRIHWIFSQRQVNPKIPTKSFVQKAPKGAKIQNIGAPSPRPR